MLRHVTVCVSSTPVLPPAPAQNCRVHRLARLRICQFFQNELSHSTGTHPLQIIIGWVSDIKEDATEVVEDSSYHHVATKEDEEERVARHRDWEQSDQEGVG